MILRYRSSSLLLSLYFLEIQQLDIYNSLEIYSQLLAAIGLYLEALLLFFSRMSVANVAVILFMLLAAPLVKEEMSTSPLLY